MYEGEAEEISGSLLDELKRAIPYYPNKELLHDLILAKVVEDLNREIQSGKIPSLPPKDEIERRYKDYLFNIRICLFKLLREQRIQDLVKSHRVILLVGAGLSSEAGIPLTKFLSKFDFKKIKEDKKMQQEFKMKFKSEFLEREIIKHTDAHNIVAEMFHRKVVIEIICLNWDDLIERAYESKFGKIRKINREEQQPFDDDNDGFYHYLWKLHGDIRDLDYDWIYPGMKGRVFQSLQKYILELKSHVLIFLIVGYSEQDEEIKEKIIEPLESSLYIYTYRIGMDLELFDKYPEKYIVIPAEWGLPMVFEEVKRLYSQKDTVS